VNPILDATEGAPERSYESGELVVRAGERGPLLVVLSGRLEVRRADVVVASIGDRGAVVGEISALTGDSYSTDVVAVEPSVVRVVPDGAAFLDANPAALRAVAELLARRLRTMTAYLADLKVQYGDAPGLAMVQEVLGTLSGHHLPPARPGSAREPDPEY
jgi:CRP/FNR family transcriptional regulator, cyclic AMP receptor protein